MSLENPLWGAPRIHGELLMLGYRVAQSTVSRYMVPRRGRPSQSWATFLRNHADAIAAIDMFTVRTLGFKRLYGFVALGLGRRVVLRTDVADHPTALWLARQITEAFPWDTAPEFLVRDNDGASGWRFAGGCAPWASATARSCPIRRGRTAMWNGSLARSAATNSTI